MRPHPKGDTEITVYGRRAVLEAVTSTGVDVLEVRVARSVAAPFRKSLAAACRTADLELTVTGSNAVRELSRDARNDQGVAARLQLANITEVESFGAMLTGTGARKPARVIALDGVTNSQNIGMIVRSAVAAGMRGMLWPLRGSPWINGLVVKASAGSIYHCPIIRAETLVDGIAHLRSVGFEIAGLTRDSEASLFDFQPPHRTVFVVGSEVSGISPEVSQLVDRWLSIPINGAVESLNVAVAASLVCFQNRTLDGDAIGTVREIRQ